MRFWESMRLKFRFQGSLQHTGLYKSYEQTGVAGDTQPTYNPGKTPGQVDGVLGYRNPAPLDAAIDNKVNVPTNLEESRVYDIKYYSRDTRRSQVHNVPVVMMHPSIQISEGDEKPALLGSPGTFANPAVATYDETGLRSAMSATHEAMNSSIEKYLPTQLPVPSWTNEAEAIIADYEKKGLPPVPGKTQGWTNLPREFTW